MSAVADTMVAINANMDKCGHLAIGKGIPVQCINISKDREIILCKDCWDLIRVKVQDGIINQIAKTLKNSTELRRLFPHHD